jgi:flagellar hook assembly protein FlgD
VLNYPNPFTTNTYFQFEHNLAGQLLDVQISIFTVSGKLVKTIQHSATPDGFRVTDIQWNGLDDYGDRLARGVYLYRVKIRGTDLSGATATAESEFEKLVILK